jgi:3-methyl-2-oxobutanoate hydroxymethyltransferase
MSNEFHPKFLRKYANLQEIINEAVTHYIQDVKAVEFPNENEQY